MTDKIMMIGTHTNNTHIHMNTQAHNKLSLADFLILIITYTFINIIIYSRKSWLFKEIHFFLGQELIYQSNLTGSKKKHTHTHIYK